MTANSLFSFTNAGILYIDGVIGLNLTLNLRQLQPIVFRAHAHHIAVLPRASGRPCHAPCHDSEWRIFRKISKTQNSRVGLVLGVEDDQMSEDREARRRHVASAGRLQANLGDHILKEED